MRRTALWLLASLCCSALACERAQPPLEPIERVGATIALSGSTLTISWRATGRRVPAHTGPNLVRVPARELWSIGLLDPRASWPVVITPPDEFTRRMASESGQLSRADVESARVSTCTRGNVAVFRLENRVGAGEWYLAEARDQQWRVRMIEGRGACEEALQRAVGSVAVR